MSTDSPRRHDPQHTALLDRIVESTADREYADAARGRGTTPRTRAALVAFAVLVAFGIMVGISAVRTAQQAPVRQQQREALVDEIHDQQRLLAAKQREIGDLRDVTVSMQERLTRDTSVGTRGQARLRQLGFNAGSLPVTGPGLRVLAADGRRAEGQDGQVQDDDLQMLVNGLWEAGAEAITINGHRVGPRTAIRTAGFAITVNYISLTQPYVVEAIGDPDTLQAGLLETGGGQLWTSLRENFRFRFDTRPVDRLTMAGNPQEHLLYAREVGG